MKGRSVRFDPKVLIRCIQDEQTKEKKISLVDDDDPSYVIFPKIKSKHLPCKNRFLSLPRSTSYKCSPIDIYETERRRLLRRAHSVAQAKLSRDKLFVTKRQMVQCNQEQKTFSRDEINAFCHPFLLDIGFELDGGTCKAPLLVQSVYLYNA